MQNLTQIKLNSLDEALKFSEIVATSGFCPKEMRGKVNDCFLAMQYGAEIGLQPMQAIQNIAVINGKPSLWGDAALALIKASCVFEAINEYVENGTAHCEVKRKNEPMQSRTFSELEAKTAGLWGRNVWKTYPNRMLQMRARGFALRDVFPDVLKGLITSDEAQDYVLPKSDKPVPKQEESLIKVHDEILKETGGHRVIISLEIQKEIEAKMRDLDLVDCRERLAAWVQKKWGVMNFKALSDKEGKELIQKLPFFAAKFHAENLQQKEEELNYKRGENEQSLILRLGVMDKNGLDTSNALMKSSNGKINGLSHAQLLAAIDWAGLNLKLKGISMGNNNNEKSKKLRIQANNIREMSQYSDVIGNDERTARELEKEANEYSVEDEALDYELAAKHDGIDYEPVENYEDIRG